MKTSDSFKIQVLKHLQRRCLKGTMFLWVNFGQGFEEGQW